jgi:hypothetical protein
MMLHNLTIGHLDPAAIVSERRIAALRPLDRQFLVGTPTG